MGDALWVTVILLMVALSIVGAIVEENHLGDADAPEPTEDDGDSEG